MADHSSTIIHMAIKIKSKTTAIALGVIVILSLAFNLFFVARPSPVTTVQYPFLDPEQAIYNNADLIVNIHPLYQELNAIATGRDVSVYFEFLNTGTNLRINDVPFYPGSLMKVPIAMAVMEKIDSGEWKMSDQLILTDADKNPAYGTMYLLPTGTVFTVQQLLNDLLVQSDDTARDIFVRNLGDQNIENVLDYLGLQDVFNTQNEVSAQRYSNFWNALYTASYLSPQSSQELLEIMNQPDGQDLLRQGIPANIAFAHKFGVYNDVYSDSGIVYAPNRPYILTVMVQSSSTAEVQETMQDISRDVYDFVTQSQ